MQLPLNFHSRDCSILHAQYAASTPSFHFKPILHPCIPELKAPHPIFYHTHTPTFSRYEYLLAEMNMHSSHSHYGSRAIKKKKMGKQQQSSKKIRKKKNAVAKLVHIPNIDVQMLPGRGEKHTVYSNSGET